MESVSENVPCYAGQKSGASALVWPRGLILPSDGANVVYLDLNHWISLAQASVGHHKGDAFIPALDACRTAKSRGSARFVLSSTHYMEVEKIKDPERRRTLADLMEELTGFTSLVNRVAIMELELATMLDRSIPEMIAEHRIYLLGKGVRHSLGLHSGVKIIGPDGDATDLVRQRMGHEKFDRLIGNAALMLERSVLRGPVGTEVGELRALGWRPEATAQCAERRAAQEKEFTPLLAQETDTSLDCLRDKVAARELIIEFENIFPRALRQRGMSVQDVLQNLGSARRFVRSMPSTAVSIELKATWHRNLNKTWTANDIFDIDAMSLAVPYCDIVVPDKEYHHALTTARFGERMSTALVRNLEDLPDVLGRWHTKYRPEPNARP